jgi:NitT/TauT family transport system ATP-binding protein
MLAPVVAAQAAGLGGGDMDLDAVMVMSLNGDTVGASPALAAAMAAEGLDFLDAAATGRALLAAAGGRLRFGAPPPN